MPATSECDSLAVVVSDSVSSWDFSVFVDAGLGLSINQPAVAPAAKDETKAMGEVSK